MAIIGPYILVEDDVITMASRTTGCVVACMQMTREPEALVTLHIKGGMAASLQACVSGSWCLPTSMPWEDCDEIRKNTS